METHHVQQQNMVRTVILISWMVGWGEKRVERKTDGE
jgi:hypothetical protein